MRVDGSSLGSYTEEIVREFYDSYAATLGGSTYLYTIYKGLRFIYLIPPSIGSFMVRSTL